MKKRLENCQVAMLYLAVLTFMLVGVFTITNKAQQVWEVGKKLKSFSDEINYNYQEKAKVGTRNPDLILKYQAEIDRLTAEREEYVNSAELAYEFFYLSGWEKIAWMGSSVIVGAFAFGTTFLYTYVGLQGIHRYIRRKIKERTET